MAPVENNILKIFMVPQKVINVIQQFVYYAYTKRKWSQRSEELAAHTIKTGDYSSVYQQMRSTEEMQYTFIMEYYSIFKKKGILPLKTIWISLWDLLFSEMSQVEGDNVTWSHVYTNRADVLEQRIGQWLVGLAGGVGEMLNKGHEIRSEFI